MFRMKPTNNKNIDIKKKVPGKRSLLRYGAIALVVLAVVVAAVQMVPGGSEDSDAADVVYFIDLSSSTPSTGVSWYGNTLIFNVDSIGNVYEVAQTTNERLARNIVFQEGVSTTVTIKNIKITGDIELTGDASVELLLSGSNDISGSVLVDSAALVQIDSAVSAGGSEGSLRVVATDEGNAAIGGGYGIERGDIIINGGSVTAIGGGDAAGIGSGADTVGGGIIIRGGTVTATGGSGSGGAGIGGGYNSEGGIIGITGGTVTATGGSVEGYALGGAGIGGGNNAEGGVIIITGGTVTAIGGSGAAGIGGGSNGDGAALTISNAASVKAYSKGELPAIHAYYVTNGTLAVLSFFVNCTLNSALPSGASTLLIYAKGDTGILLETLSVPAGYKGFAFQIPVTTAAKDYNIYLQGDLRKVLRNNDGSPIIPSISRLNGYNSFNGNANNGVLPVKLDTAVFVAVTEITGVPSSATAGTDLTLVGTAVPSDATYSLITWTVNDAGTTKAKIDGNKLSAESAGIVVVTATVADGESLGVPFAQDFEITVSKAEGSGGGSNVLLWAVIAIAIIAVLAVALFFAHKMGMI